MKQLKKILKELNACNDAIIFVGNMTIEEAVGKCERGDWLLWIGKKLKIDVRKLTLAKGYCANTVRHLMKDERSIKAVDAAIQFGNGLIDEIELRNAAAAASAASAAAYAAYAADYAAAYDTSASVASAATSSSAAAAYAAYAAAYAASATAATSAASDADAAYAAAAYAASSVDYAVASTAAKKEIQLQTANICKEYIGQLIINAVNEKL